MTNTIDSKNIVLPLADIVVIFEKLASITEVEWLFWTSYLVADFNQK
jgi:hypothetical protein